MEVADAVEGAPGLGAEAVVDAGGVGGGAADVGVLAGVGCGGELAELGEVAC